MTLSLPDQVRLRIQDRYRWQSEEFFGNGFDSQFKLAQGQPFSTVISGSAYNRLVTGYTATGAAFDAAFGLVTFSGVISANSAVKVNYQWSVFSDDEIGQFTAMGGGSVAGAALEAIKTLQFDSLKRARWATPDGTQYDDTKAQDTLLKMYAQLWTEVRESPAGGIESWSEQQQYYQSEYNA